MIWKKIALDLKSTKRWELHRPQVVCIEEDVAPLFEEWDKLPTNGMVIADQVVRDFSYEDGDDYLLLDCGGSMWKHRHEYPFEIDGLRLRIPAGHVAIWRAAMSIAPVEHLRGERRYSMSANPYWNWLISQNQFDALGAYLESIEEEAEAIANAENLRFNELVRNSRGMFQADERDVKKVKDA